MKNIIVLILLFILNSCANLENFTTQSSDSTFKVEQNKTTNDIKIYFSKISSNYQNGIDDLIIKDINSAKNSIYLAMYSFTNRKILNALNSAKERGVEVKIVADDEELTKSYNLYESLSNITPQGDNRACSDIMHNKIVVIDGNISWSGSANFTYSYYRNYENMIRVSNKDIALKYQDEIKEILNDNLVNNPLENSKFKLYNSPTDDIESKVINLIENANSRVYILAYTFTSENIKDALIRAQNRGVEVKVILDKSRANLRYSQYQNLKDANIFVKLIGSRNHLMHNKILIVDNYVATGSYNFTKSANFYNCENFIFINDKDILKNYIEYIKKF